MSKRLVVCCDETWNVPDERRTGVAAPTNVAKLTLGLRMGDGAGQCVYYDQRMLDVTQVVEEPSALSLLHPWREELVMVGGQAQILCVMVRFRVGLSGSQLRGG